MKIKKLKTLLDEYPEDMETVEVIDLSIRRLFDYSNNRIGDEEYLSLLSADSEVYDTINALNFLERMDDECYPVLRYLSDVLRVFLRYRVRFYCDGEFVNSGGEPVNMGELEAECESKLKQLTELLGDDFL